MFETSTSFLGTYQCSKCPLSRVHTNVRNVHHFLGYLPKFHVPTISRVHNECSKRLPVTWVSTNVRSVHFLGYIRIFETFTSLNTLRIFETSTSCVGTYKRPGCPSFSWVPPIVCAVPTTFLSTYECSKLLPVFFRYVQMVGVSIIFLVTPDFLKCPPPF